MTKGERIRELRERTGFSQVSLAEKIGVSKQTLYKYENDIITNIPPDKIERIAGMTGSSPAYIMGWQDEAVSDPPGLRPVSTRRYPVLASLACGEPVFQEERELYVESGADTQIDFILTVKGDSMTGARIHDGDTVFVRRQETVENGEIAVVAIDDEATLKRFYRYSDDLIVLRAENPAYKDMVYTPEDNKDIRVLGKAVAFQSDVR